MNQQLPALNASLPGLVRTLKRREMPLLKSHLLRLDPESRHDRFNGVADEDFVRRYADRCLTDGTVVIAYVEDGQVRAAAEMHPSDDASDDAPEVAFSVEREFRRKGLGSVLFVGMIEEAKRQGYTGLRITTGSDNNAMRGLARKFGARLTFRYGESSGLLDLSQAPVVDAAEPASQAPDAAAVWTAPLDLAETSIRLNRDYWRSVMNLCGFGRAA